jgi:hypothetical protein
MSFLKHIKRDMNDPYNYRGLPKNKIMVDYNDLKRLLECFEQLDNEKRAINAFYNKENYGLDYVLSEVIKGLYHQKGKNSEVVLLVIMNTLKPLIEEKIKIQDIERR